MKKWHRRTQCIKCKRGFDTYGGVKFLFFKIRKWEHICKCKNGNYIKPEIIPIPKMED